MRSAADYLRDAARKATNAAEQVELGLEVPARLGVECAARDIESARQRLRLQVHHGGRRKNQ